MSLSIYNISFANQEDKSQLWNQIDWIVHDNICSHSELEDIEYLWCINNLEENVRKAWQTQSFTITQKHILNILQEVIDFRKNEKNKYALKYKIHDNESQLAALVSIDVLLSGEVIGTIKHDETWIWLDIYKDRSAIDNTLLLKWEWFWHWWFAWLYLLDLEDFTLEKKDLWLYMRYLTDSDMINYWNGLFRWFSTKASETETLEQLMYCDFEALDCRILVVLELGQSFGMYDELWPRLLLKLDENWNSGSVKYFNKSKHFPNNPIGELEFTIN